MSIRLSIFTLFCGLLTTSITISMQQRPAAEPLEQIRSTRLHTPSHIAAAEAVAILCGTHYIISNPYLTPATATVVSYLIERYLEAHPGLESEKPWSDLHCLTSSIDQLSQASAHRIMQLALDTKNALAPISAKALNKLSQAAVQGGQYAVQGTSRIGSWALSKFAQAAVQGSKYVAQGASRMGSCLHNYFHNQFAPATTQLASRALNALPHTARQGNMHVPQVPASSRTAATQGIHTNVAQQNCPVCLEDITNNTFIVLPCAHRMCSECANTLYTHHAGDYHYLYRHRPLHTPSCHHCSPRCPTCRHPFDIDRSGN